MYYEFKNEFNKKKKLTTLPGFVHLLVFSFRPSFDTSIDSSTNRFIYCMYRFIHSFIQHFCYILQCRKLHYIRLFTNESNFQIQFLQSNICYILISQITLFSFCLPINQISKFNYSNFFYSNCFKRNYV